MGKEDLPVPSGQILFVKKLDLFKMVLKQGKEGFRESRDAVFGSFPRTNSNTLQPVIDVMGSQPDGLADSLSASIKQLDDQLWDPLEESNDPPHLLTRQDHRDIHSFPGPDRVDLFFHPCLEDLLVQEDQGVYRLILRGGGDVPIHRKMSKELFDLLFPVLKLLSALHVVGLHITLDPLNIGALGMDRVVMRTHNVSNLL